MNIKNSNKFEQELLKTELSVDILVNNAGITKDNLLVRMQDDEIDNVIDI